MRRTAITALLVGALVTAGACGGDDDDSAGGGAGTTVEAGDDASGDSGDGGGEDGGDGGEAVSDPACEGPPFTIDLRAADVYHGLEPFEDAEFEVVDTVAVKVADAAYTMYLADYEIDREAVGGFETLHPPAGKTLITLSITVFNAEEEPLPIEVGDVIPAGGEFGEQTFIVFVERGADMYNSNLGVDGEVEVLGLSGDEICVSVDYSDYEEETALDGEQQASPVQKRLAGTVSAEVVEMGF